MKYIIDGNEIDVIIKRNKLRQQTYFRMKNNYLQVNTSKLTSDKAVYSMLNSLDDKLTNLYRKHIKTNLIDEEFWFLGKRYDLITSDNEYFEEDRFYVKSNFDLDKFYKNAAKKVFKERLDYCLNIFKYNIGDVKLYIRMMKTRWGVCNTKLKKITLNTKLIRYDKAVIDYVIIHELSHLIEANHSKKFWAVVEEHLPDYKKYIKVLKGDL